MLYVFSELTRNRLFTYGVLGGFSPGKMSRGGFTAFAVKNAAVFFSLKCCGSQPKRNHCVNTLRAEKGVIVITNQEFVEKLTDIARNTPTKYMWGTFGSLINGNLIRQKVAQYPNNYSNERQNALYSLAGKNVWAFDCIGLIKGVLWGWKGEPSLNYGGAVYASGGVPDVTADGMFRLCRDIGEVREDLLPGTVLSVPGHIGVYAGDRKVIEATLGRRGDGVVISDLSDVGWRQSGTLPWLDYRGGEAVTPGTSAGQSGKIAKGSVVRVKPGARVYQKTYGFASYVYDAVWVVSEVIGDRAVIDRSADGSDSINSPIHVSDLIPAENG